MTNERSQLLPCPFCGAAMDANDEDTIYPTGSGWKNERGFRSYHSFLDVPKTQRCYRVRCECGAEISGDGEAEAISKWNTRQAARAAPAMHIDDAECVMYDSLQTAHKRGPVTDDKVLLDELAKRGVVLARAAPAQPEGEVVVTWDEDRKRIIAVTRQDGEGRILSVLAEATPLTPAPANPTLRELLDAFDGAPDYSGPGVRP